MLRNHNTIGVFTWVCTMSCEGVDAFVLVCLVAACFNDFAHVQQLMLTAARFCFGNLNISRGAEGHNFGVQVALRLRRKVPGLVIEVVTVQVLAAKFLSGLRADVGCKHQCHKNGSLPPFGCSFSAPVVGSNMPVSLSANQFGGNDGFVGFAKFRQLKAKPWKTPITSADAVGKFLEHVRFPHATNAHNNNEKAQTIKTRHGGHT